MFSKKTAQESDKKDALAKFRYSFGVNKNEIYLDGNSLGKLPLNVPEIIGEVIEKQWGSKLIRSWNDHWLELPKRISRTLEKILHADQNTVSIGDSTSVNLYKLVHGLLASGKYPTHLISDCLNFPTDNYILQGLGASFSIASPTIVNYSSDLEADIELLKAKIKENSGIVCLSLVSYKSAYLYPMKALNLFAKEHQSIIIWDLSHAVGAVHIDLKETDTLAAVGCTYKYLNGGPGAPAFLYVSASILPYLNTPIQGWFGHARPFDFSAEFIPSRGIEKFDAGTPSILSIAAMEAGIDLTHTAGIESIRKKSEALTSFLQLGIETELIPLGYTLESPPNSAKRGSHITISHHESWRICKALMEGKKNRPKIIPDFRPNRFIRLGIAPLYISFEEIWTTVERLKEIVLENEFLAFDQERPTVT